MTTSFRTVCNAAALTAAFAIAQPARAPIASNPVVTLEGKILKVQIARGQGMPFLEVQFAEKTTKVFLGAMRYLIEQNFNPKAGERVTVKGYQTGPDIIAITVDLPAENKSLRLRDENGFPLWGGRMMMRGMHHW